MNDPMAILNTLVAQLATISGVKTCKVGLEANLTPDDYPIIRLAPSQLTPNLPGVGQRALTLTVYFGAALLEAKDGLAAVYAELFRLDVAIREALVVTVIAADRAARGNLQIAYLDTLTDEDRLPHYKLFASRFEIEG
jgi:hypothetical protein